MATTPRSTPSIPTSSGPDPSRAERVPPQDLEAEMSLLGSMLLHRDAIGDVVPLISRGEADRFYLPEHRKLYEVLVDMYDADQAIDLVTFRNELSRRGLLEQVGGVDYVVQLVESVPSHLHAEHYARLVVDKAMLRELISAAGKISEEAYAHYEEARDIIDRAEQSIFLVSDQRVRNQATLIAESLEEIFHQIESREGHYITGVPTGFIELDDMLSGMQRGEMIVVAARPSMGKTAFGLSVAEHVAVNAGIPAAFFSMEMSQQALAQRMLCSRGRVDSHKLRRGMLTEMEIEGLKLVCDELQNVPLFIDDSVGVSVLELRATARRLRARYKVEVVFIDYLQLMHAAGRPENRQQEVAEISRGLKGLARELSIPVVVMAQLNRNPEGRTDKRPMLSDLRESGAIEQDADVVLFLHREEYYYAVRGQPAPESCRGQAEVIIAKQRNGPTGSVKLMFDQRRTCFRNLAVGMGGFGSGTDPPDDRPYPNDPSPAGGGAGFDDDAPF